MNGRPRPRRRLLVALCGVLVLLVGTPASAQESDDGFVAEPVPGSHLAPDGGYFLIEASPGEEVRQEIGLRNDSAGPLEIRIAAVDATTGQLGGASYALADERASRTGRWITVEESSVTLAPGASAVVLFVVDVPDDARSGHHLAGLSIAAPSQQSGTDEGNEGQAGASIDVQTRRIIAVQVNVPGPAEPELVVDGVTPAARPDGLYLEISIENQGRGLTKAQGVIRVGEDFEREFDVDTFVPGTSIAYPIKWSDVAEDGRYEAEVELRYGDETAEWEGSFEVGDETLEELADRQVSPPGQDADTSGTPVLGIVLAVVVALLIVGGVVRAQRRHTRTKDAHERG